jgi:hypothetical protein
VRNGALDDQAIIPSQGIAVQKHILYVKDQKYAKPLTPLLYHVKRYYCETFK